MKIRLIGKSTIVTVAIALTVGCVCAGELAVTIKQPFKAGGKDYPAGHYLILADPDGDHINLRNIDQRTDNVIKFATRLSAREGQSGEVVFDKVENDLYLAEIYIIGMDGFFFQGAPGKHKHLVVKEDQLR